jgi:pimeloyl-ACP methyl ester carboxylesterase
MMVGGQTLEVIARGAGRPIVLLHGPDTIAPDAMLLDRLAVHGRVIAPSHPGFGDSPRPDGFETVYDLVRLYLALLDEIGEGATLIGFSFGGWLAAEIAVACCHKLRRLVLVDAVGIRVSADPARRDIMDFFNTHPREVRRRSWHDPARAPDYDAMSDEALIRHARNRDALSLYAWEPHMFNPRLKAWLWRIAVPTLVLWGAGDQVVTPDYGRAYAAAIPGARFSAIEGAGHYPEQEQPETLVRQVVAFLDG